MNWIAENWLVLVFGGGMLGMHLFGHGHGGKKKAQGGAHSPDEKSDAVFEEPVDSRGDLAQDPKIKLVNATEHADFAVVKPKT